MEGLSWKLRPVGGEFVSCLCLWLVSPPTTKRGDTEVYSHLPITLVVLMTIPLRVRFGDSFCACAVVGGDTNHGIEKCIIDLANAYYGDTEPWIGNLYIGIMNFFTATINSWKHLLEDDRMKDIVVSSLRWLDQHNKAYTCGLVIMPNHIHILWSYADENYDAAEALLRFTGHAFQKELKARAPEMLQEYQSLQADREYQFWERRSKTIETKSRDMLIQKLNYIHNNPLQEKWKLVELPEQYRYSSARFYMQMDQEFGFLRHYTDFS